MVLEGNFCEMSAEEEEIIEGGSKGAAQVIMIVGGAAIAGVLAPITCGGSLGAYVAGASVGYGLMITGASM